MTSESKEKRRHRRIPLHLPIRVLGGALPPQEYLTEDVSYAGIFIRTDSPFALRQLLQVEIVLPNTRQHLKILAMVAHRLSAEEAADRGRIPGMGLNLYGLGHAAREAWEDFIAAAEAAHDAAHGGSAAELARAVLEPIRRAHPRTLITLRAQIPSVDTMYAMLTRDLSEGGTFLQTDVAPAPGTRVVVVLIHPDDGSEFSMPGTVARVVEEPPSERGVGVAFDALSDPQRAAFRRFIESGLPMLDDILAGEILIETDDPLLL